MQIRAREIAILPAIILPVLSTEDQADAISGFKRVFHYFSVFSHNGWESPH